MSRLIDVEALPTSIENMDLEVAEKIVERWMQDAPCDISWDAVRVLRDFYDEVKDAPTIVEFEGDINKVIVKGEEYHRVVRCKDCKHWYSDADTGMACEFTNMGQPEDGFCNWAERRSDEKY